MRQLRGLSADTLRTFTETTHYGQFGNAHNIAANVGTETLYVIGATSAGPGWTPCSGEKICQQKNKHDFSELILFILSAQPISL